MSSRNYICYTVGEKLWFQLHQQQLLYETSCLAFVIFNIKIMKYGEEVENL